jgi:uncharacterized protein (TIGR02996 family)
MTEHDALLAAVIAAPADDLPRLVYADWVEEHGEPDRAAFIRGQIELARTPPWEPFAVRCRHFHADDLDTGRRWLDRLPDLGDWWYVRWDDRHAYRRGFGWGLAVEQPPALVGAGNAVFAAAPVGRLALSSATLDDWRAFARRPWLARVTDITFAGLNSPNEPAAVLGESPFATGLRDLTFDRSDIPGMPEVLERLMRSPVGPRLTGLHFTHGCEFVEDMIDALAAGPAPPRLDRLSYPAANLDRHSLKRLLDLPVVPSLTFLRLTRNWLGVEGAKVVADAPALAGVADLDLSRCALEAPAIAELVATTRLTNLRRLDLNRNTIGPDGVALLAAAPAFAGLRAVDLHQTGADDRALPALVRGRFWPNLVELDLRENRITDAGARVLLGAGVPPDLVALRLDGNLIGEAACEDLRRHFGDRVTCAGR